MESKNIFAAHKVRNACNDKIKTLEANLNAIIDLESQTEELLDSRKYEALKSFGKLKEKVVEAENKAKKKMEKCREMVNQNRRFKFRVPIIRMFFEKPYSDDELCLHTTHGLTEEREIEEEAERTIVPDGYIINIDFYRESQPANISYTDKNKHTPIFDCIALDSRSHWSQPGYMVHIKITLLRENKYTSKRQALESDIEKAQLMLDKLNFNQDFIQLDNETLIFLFGEH